MGAAPGPTAAAPPDQAATDGALEGTISYMSPEQIRNDKDLDHRTDIYSLGSVLYEVLAGRPPVVGNSVDEILNQTLAGGLAMPSRVANALVPPRLEAICMRCLALSADERVQTAGELIRELQEDW